MIFGLIHKITFWKLKFDTQLEGIYLPQTNFKIVSYIFDSHGKELCICSFVCPELEKFV